jgi:hypothetical protein
LEQVELAQHLTVLEQVELAQHLTVLERVGWPNI